MPAFSALLNALRANPHRIFLLDGLGAMLTAFLLAGVLVPFEASFGMPGTVLYALAAVAGLFTLYSFGCYALRPRCWKPFLKAIALANSLYCLLTLALVVLLHRQLTPLGVLYFAGEGLVIGALVWVEVRLVRG